MKPIRVGILGFAHGHVNAYCNAWREQPAMGVRVVAGWDADPARAKNAATTHGIEIPDSAAALLARPDIDAVVITSETAFHADLVEQAANAGKAIALQKPLALTLDQADRIVVAVNRTRVPFTLAWQMRTDPHNLAIRGLMADPAFGRLTMLRRKHGLTTHRWKDFDQTWHVNPAMNRDIFADDAAHAADFIYWLLGMPASVMAELGSLRNPRIPNDHAIAVFRYPDGTFAEMVCSFAAAGGENSVEVLFENGVIVLNHGDQPTSDCPWPAGAIQLKWIHEGDKQWTVSDLPDIHNQGQRIQGLAVPLAEFFHGQRPPIATAAEGRDVLRMIQACYDSSENGKRINL